jgi:hypothetical protein
MKHSPKSQTEDKAKYRRKYIIRIVIIIILCCMLTSDSDERTEKPRLGQIANTASQCEVVSSLKDT